MYSSLYTLENAARLFKVNPSTLRRWCRCLGIKPSVSLFDRRRLFLSEIDVLALAIEHNRVIAQPSLEQLERLVERVGDLERKLCGTEK